MGQAASDAGRKLVAIGVLALAAYILFKLVVGFVTSIAISLVAVMAGVAVIWALRAL